MNNESNADDSNVEMDSDAIDQINAAQDDPAPMSRDEELEAMRREVEEANKRVLLSQAESENFRKRMRRDYEDQLKFASLNLISDILQVRDNLVRASVAAQNSGSVDSLRDGVAMVAKQLDDTLAKYGVSKIDDSGAFDPNVHEAISQMPSADHEAGTIAHVAVTGFTLHERVIRPSQVVISTGAPQAS